MKNRGCRIKRCHKQSVTECVQCGEKVCQYHSVQYSKSDYLVRLCGRCKAENSKKPFVRRGND
jgi:hypothetical protein